MFNTIKLLNVDEFRKWDKHSRMTFKAQGEAGVIGAEFELNTVGPCVARLYVPVEGKKEPQEFLLGVYEGNQTVQFAIKADTAAVTLEPSGEVWYRNSQSFRTAENPNPDETFTRMELMGVEQDELSIILHRQAVLNRIENGRQQYQQDAYTRKLERMIEETNARVEALTTAALPPEQEAELSEVP